MKKHQTLMWAAAVLGMAAFSSCSTPAGSGAATGAVAGAVVGGPVGAAAGAAGGAIIGAAVGTAEARNYGPMPKGGYPNALPSPNPGMVESPYSHRMYDVRGVPHGGLVRDVDANKLFRVP